jgi:DNA-binding CsgD family transcriptional regulator/tetratricopeptide (TPR) repeat protein
MVSADRRRTLAIVNRFGPFLCPVLIGRDELLALADRRLEEAVDGRGQMLLLSGGAGVGKSRLVGAVLDKAAQRGFRVAVGDLAPQDRDVPAASLLDLARSMQRTPRFTELGQSLLDLRDGAATADRPARRMLVLDVIDRIAASATKPTALVFEDLQWADDLSLEIMTELARRIRDLPLLLLGTYRSDDLPPEASLRDWRARLLTQRFAEEARLLPLTREGTALMTTLILGTGLPAPSEVVAALFERTDGVPLHIEELLGAMSGDARFDGQQIREAAVPETIEDAVMERVRRRSKEAQAVLRAGAVLGRCFVPDVLAGIMDVSPDELEAPLGELVDHGFLDQPGPLGLFDYRHQLLRDVLYRHTPMAERRRLHARAGEFGAALEGASEVHASAHFELAGLSAQAFRTALAGARAAVRLSSHREAFELYRRALGNMPADLDPAEEASILAAFSDEAAAIEMNEVSESNARRARERYLAAGRPLDAAEMLITLAALSRREGRPIAERRDYVRAGLTELAKLTPTPEVEALRAIMHVIRARSETDSMSLAAARDSATEARALAAAAGDEATVIEADSLVAFVDVLSGRVETGLAALGRAALEARERGHEDVSVTAYRDAADVAVRVMSYQAAEDWLAQGMRYADSTEQSHCRHVMAATATHVAWAAGRWDEATEVGEQELADRDCARSALGASVALGYVAMGRGELDRARQLLDDVEAQAAQSHEVASMLQLLWGRAETDLLDGAPSSASESCERALSLAAEMGESALLIPFLVTGVRAQLSRTRPDLAMRWLNDAVPLVASMDDLAGPAISHAQGLVRLAAGSIVAARDALDAAVRGWDGLGRVWEASWARLDLAGCLMRTQRFAAAASLLAEVRATAERLDSRPLAARADELGRVTRTRGTLEEPWRPLTAREFEVARLIAEGMTNGEIADELSIAPKTASAHVEHILAKLGLSRRAEIAAWTATIARSERIADSHFATARR